MTFKKKLIVSCVSIAFIITVLAGSLIAIFANNSLSLRTVLSINYSAPGLEDTYVSMSSWLRGAQSKTTNLASTKVTAVSGNIAIEQDLSEDEYYLIMGYHFENISPNFDNYLRLTYTDGGSENISMGYLVVDEEQMPEDLDEDDFQLKPIKSGETRVVANNVVIPKGLMNKVYVMAKINDLTRNALFEGSFSFALQLDEFDEIVEVYEDAGSVSGYAVKMGEMPQSYIGTDGSAYTLTEEVYTENSYTNSQATVNYPVYQDASGDKYALKNSAYYKFEPIVWDVLGYYNSDEYTAYSATAFSNGVSSNLVVISRNVLYRCYWNQTYVDIDYADATIFSSLETFYDNVLANHSDKITARNVDYNDTTNVTSLKDNGDYHIETEVWLLSYTEANSWYSGNTARVASQTNWSAGSSSAGNYPWWLRSSSDNYADYSAGRVSDSGSIVNSDVNYNYGVRPALLINL